MSKVTVIDYGIGNLYSVRHAFEHCGSEVLVTSSPADIEKAERLVIPGVGAFADGMLAFREQGFLEPVLRYADSGRPVLGICLGMQMLFDEGEEFGTHAGIGLIPGKVVAIPSTDANGLPHRIPHIGWSSLLASSSGWEGSILADTPVGSAAYFVHSFHAVPKNSAHLLAYCDYDGIEITAAVQKGLIFGCQFHPEKSANIGLGILRRFLHLEGQ